MDSLKKSKTNRTKQKKQCLVKPKFARTPFETSLDIFIKQASLQVNDYSTKTIVSNEQKFLLVILVPLQTFRVRPFSTLESLQGLHTPKSKKKWKKNNNNKNFVVRARLYHAAYQNFFPYLFHLCRYPDLSGIACGGAGGGLDRNVQFGQRPRSSRCFSVQCVYFGSIKREIIYLWLQQLKLGGT